MEMIDDIFGAVFERSMRSCGELCLQLVLFCCAVLCVLVRESRMQQQLRVQQSPWRILETVHTVVCCLACYNIAVVAHRPSHVQRAVYYAFTF
jgi:hypothetical protein